MTQGRPVGWFRAVAVARHPDGIVACSARDALDGIPVMILSGHRHLTNDFNADDPGPRKCWSSFRILSAPMLFDVPA